MRPILLSLFAITISITALAQQSILKYELSCEIPRGPLTIVDSTVYTHGNSRSSVILPAVQPPAYQHPGGGDYAYDSMYFYRMENGQYSLRSRSYRLFNSANMMTEIGHENIGSSGPVFAGKSTFSYNSAMLPDTIVRIEPGLGDTRQTFAYAGNKLVAHRREYFFSSTNSWETNTLDSFIATGGVGGDSVRVSYNKSGGVYTEVVREKYIRNSNNNILIDSIFSYGAFWREVIYTYDIQGRLIMDSLCNWDGVAMHFLYKRRYSYNSNSFLTGVRHFAWTPANDIDSFKYNNNNQIISYEPHDSTGKLLIPARVTYYFYHDPVSVPEVTTTNNLQLYPIPATSYINLAIQFTKPQAFSVRIFDMQGRLVNNWQEPAQKQYNKQITLTNMAPGQYTVHILAGNESVTKQFMVVR